jgi:polyhydroxyalkanoate synthase subunit PhaC
MTTPTPDPAEWLSNLFKSQTDMLQRFGTNRPGSAATSDAAVPAQWQEFSNKLNALQQDYFRQIATLWPWPAAAPAGTAAAQDKRFAGEAWRADPRLEMATRSYLVYSGLLRGAIDAAPLDDQSKSQWGFAARQLVDAMSPANFLATNPEAIQLVLETGGQSLVEGMGLLVQDLLKGRITMTDETAFELGRNVATTPGSVIFENELMQLIRYTPLTPQVHKHPLLMVPPCINKFYILDLQPDNSLVRYALEQGHMVFMVSWRNATPEMGKLTWDDYLQSGATKAIDVALEVDGAEKLNALGFCLGGTLLSCAVAVMKPADKDRVASLTLLTTMLDFVDTGELGLLVTEQSVASREEAIGTQGVMRGADLSLAFSSLRANDLIWPYVVNSYLKGKVPPAFDLLYWNSDATNLPGPMYCWYLRNMYLENRLREPGQTVHCGVPLDLANLDMPAYLYASREDHIVPWRTAYASRWLLGGEATFVLGASGHIAGVINPASKNKRSHWVGTGAKCDADEWLAGAADVPGSWWPNWSAWLARHAGPMVAVREAPARSPYRPIEAAPGRYVKEKAE